MNKLVNEEAKVPPISRETKFIKKGVKAAPTKAKKTVQDPVIDAITPPVPCTRKNCHKKYQVNVQFHTKSDAKSRQKTILFGDTAQIDYVDTRDEKTKDAVLSRLRKYHNPLEPNFYRFKLLNCKPTLQEAYVSLVQENLPKL
jgi:hypothetical protein